MTTDLYVRGIERLIAVVQELSRVRTVQDIQTIVRTAARQLTGADGATIVFRDNDHCFYADEDAITPLWKGKRFPATACVSGWVMLNKCSAIIEDIYSDPRIPADTYRPTFVKSMAIVPIRTEDPVGAIGNYWADHRKPSENQVKLLQALADSTAIAMENVRVATTLANTERQLHLTQKMEAMGRFAGGIAHDFNNILSVVLTSAHMAQSEGAGSPAVVTHMNEIILAGKRGAELTRQLLTFSRKQPVRLALLDLGHLVLDMEPMFQRLFGAGIDLSIVTEQSLWKVNAEPSQMEQILMNLAVNARDAMPAGGKLFMETSNVVIGEDSTLTHPDVRPGAYVLLTVRDSGIGMDDDTLSKIFEPFFTTKEKVKGTGLGLATVFGIVKQSGGHISVASTLGQGTTFKIYFPRAEGAGVVRSEEAAAGPHARNHGSETILLVDDDVQVRSVVRSILRRAGYKVLDASSAGEAILVCEQHAATIHLLLTDVVLPKLGGRQLAERLLKHRQEMKVLFMSGYTDDAELQRGILESNVPFLQKPFMPDVLMKKVREVLTT